MRSDYIHTEQVVFLMPEQRVCVRPGSRSGGLHDPVDTRGQWMDLFDQSG